jgi:hypothetical protein
MVFVGEREKIEGEDGIWVTVPRRPKLAEHVARGPKKAPVERKLKTHADYRIWRRQHDIETMLGLKQMSYNINIYDHLPPPDDSDDAEEAERVPAKRVLAVKPSSSGKKAKVPKAR